MRIPLADIDAHALPRDRTVLDAAALAELQASIAATGLRQPIEVFATDTGYALISGYRRLHATQALHDLTGDPRHAQIDAILRTPADRTAALAAMVAENDIRQPLSVWEQAAIATATLAQDVFDTLDAALAALYPHANRQKRARLRGVAEVVEALDGLLIDPETMSENRLMRLANTLRLGWGEIIETALTQADARTPAAQWQALRAVLEEAETLLAEHRPTTPNRPKRLSHPRAGVTIRRERTRTGFLLHITGRHATDVVVSEVLDQIEQMFGPG